MAFEHLLGGNPRERAVSEALGLAAVYGVTVQSSLSDKQIKELIKRNPTAENRMNKPRHWSTVLDNAFDEIAERHGEVRIEHLVQALRDAGLTSASSRYVSNLVKRFGWLKSERIGRYRFVYIRT